MTARKKPFSAKQKKEQLQLKRAVKRGDAEPAPKLDRHGRPRKPTAPSARNLQSSFVKLPAAFLDHTRKLASDLPLTRPIPPSTAVWHDLSDGPTPQPNTTLTCPRRPKWRYDMSKKDVEANEEGLFKKWLTQTDAILAASISTLHAVDSAPPATMPSAPTSFERNLEVWRQLWRVTEISQILLVLLDARCPLLHYPPALAHYLAGLPRASRTRTILVLTKVDIVGPARADAWSAFLRARYPGTRVVQVEAYADSRHEHQSGDGQGAKKPHLPSTFRGTLVHALQDAHAELLEPPETVRGDAEKLARWRPRVRRDVDWSAVLEAEGERVVGGGTAPRSSAHPHAGEASESDDHEGARPEDESGEGEEGQEPEFLTIGLIGQPNVGKSSLLNALFGVHKVKASRTPGKTKHFQTLFWTPEVRLVDCPGLVMPNFVPMETQVLSALLPISRVSAVSLCTHHAAQLLPLERVLQLAHPALLVPPPTDKRTWRPGGGTRPPADTDTRACGAAWTATDVLTAYALRRGWVTAKAGRPDVNRAGNAALRALAEGRIRWAFWPPGTDPRVVEAHQGRIEGAGIWIADAAVPDDSVYAYTDTDTEGTAGSECEGGSQEEGSEEEGASEESEAGGRGQSVRCSDCGSWRRAG